MVDDRNFFVATPGTRSLLRVCVLGLFSILACGAEGPELPTDDGLYATFEVSRRGASVGTFTCQLEFEKVPRTVANFVGLAEGQLSWVDFQRGYASRNPFYDGIVFHRVVGGFVIQAGSPNGQGTDGPGYTFPDEFDPSLRHDAAGILSMANAGPNSNGSQFFVTLEARPDLDDLHNVFGHVTAGLNVIHEVRQGDVIDRVTITRNGASAVTFDVTAQGLPSVFNAETTIQATPSGFHLIYPQPPSTEFYAFHSDALTAWNQVAGQELHGVNPVARERDVSAQAEGKKQLFFSVTRVEYPDPIYTPASMVGHELTLTDHGGFSMTWQLSAANTGTYSYTTGDFQLESLRILSYVWSQEAYRGLFNAGITGLTATGGLPITRARFSLVFTSATGGTYAGNLSTIIGQRAPIQGTFTLAELPP